MKVDSIIQNVNKMKYELQLLNKSIFDYIFWSFIHVIQINVIHRYSNLTLRSIILA